MHPSSTWTLSPLPHLTIHSPHTISLIYYNNLLRKRILQPVTSFYALFLIYKFILFYHFIHCTVLTFLVIIIIVYKYLYNFDKCVDTIHIY